MFWGLNDNRGPVVATAIHDGHDLREEVARHCVLSDADRLREEDPFTGAWCGAGDTRIVVGRSRFEVDLNRPRDRAVYRTPEEAWGLTVWRSPLPADVIARSLDQYDAFYAMVEQVLRGKIEQEGRVVVLDLHSYNHRRGGPTGEPASPDENPQVNIGTGTMDRARWAPVVDRFIDDLASFGLPIGRLDVRENVKFRGGNFSRWVHETFPQRACAIAVEIKKFFMDEWTGVPAPELVSSVGRALAAAAAGVREVH